MNHLTIIKFRVFDQDALEMRLTEQPMSDAEIMNVVTQDSRTGYLTDNVIQYDLINKKEIEIAHTSIGKKDNKKFRKFLGE